MQPTASQDLWTHPSKEDRIVLKKIRLRATNTRKLHMICRAEADRRTTDNHSRQRSLEPMWVEIETSPITWRMAKSQEHKTVRLISGLVNARRLFERLREGRTLYNTSESALLSRGLPEPTRSCGRIDDIWFGERYLRISGIRPDNWSK